MVRSLFLLSLLPVLAFADHGADDAPGDDHGNDAAKTSLILPSNIEQWPTIINDLTSYQTSAFLSTFPTGTLEPVNPYPTGGSSAPVYGTPSVAPYPTSGTSDQAPSPTATETATAPPAATTTTLATYAPPPTEPSNNASGSATPAPTQIAGANTFTVKLPVVLGALGLVFAML